MIHINAAVESYKNDLPSSELVDEELVRWKSKFEKLDEKRPNSCAKSLPFCDSKYFPYVFVLLKIAATIPVTSCE